MSMRQRAWLITAGISLAIVIALMSGYAVGRAVSPDAQPVTTTSAAQAGPADDSSEAGFARDMSTHHAQAVEMAMIAAARATNPDVRSLGYDIALTQENQIGTMQTWLSFWGLNPTSDSKPMAWMPEGTAALKEGLMPGMATQEQMQQLRDAQGKQVDIIFLRLILAHHLGGIHMVEGVLAQSQNTDVTALASNMKQGQQREVTVIQQLQKQVGA